MERTLIGFISYWAGGWGLFLWCSGSQVVAVRGLGGAEVVAGILYRASIECVSQTQVDINTHRYIRI